MTDERFKPDEQNVKNSIKCLKIRPITHYRAGVGGVNEEGVIPFVQLKIKSYVKFYNHF